jgi:23S rRNA (uracil1939-C5)-methyltransferase
MSDTYTIEALGPAGDGIARHENGSAIFIPLTAPGDVVRAAVKKDHEGNWRGQLGEVISAGPDRTEASCVHYGRCGGCTLQHLKPDFYSAYKKDAVAQLLVKAGLAVQQVDEPVLLPVGRRRRATFSFTKKGKDITIGFNAPRSHDVMNVQGCLVVMPEIMELVRKLKTPLADMVAAKNGDVFIQCVDGLMEVSITAKLNDGLAFHEALATMVRDLGIARINARSHDRQSFELLLESAPMIKKFGPLSVNLPLAAFLQPSDEGEKILIDLVMEMAAGGKNFADLFCGCGTFTGPLSTSGNVAAIDSSKEAIHSLVQASGGRPVSPVARNLFSDPLSAKELKVFDTVVLDPPRAGAKEQCAELACSTVERIVYVSCNAQSFVRDVKILAGGGYQIKRVQPVDQFTWSAHCELVSLIEKG